MNSADEQTIFEFRPQPIEENIYWAIILLIVGVAFCIMIIYAYTNQGLTALGGLVFPVFFFYLGYRGVLAARYGLYAKFYSDKVRVASYGPPSDVPFEDIEGFRFIVWDIGGYVYMYLKSGLRVRLPEGQDDNTVCKQLIKLTNTEESSKRLNERLDRRAWVILLAVMAFACICGGWSIYDQWVAVFSRPPVKADIRSKN